MAVVVLVLASGGAVYALTQSDQPLSERLDRNTSTQPEVPEEPTTAPAPLTGIEVDPDQAKAPITGVMIENSPNARPQTGLDAADIVFEAVAEGGITRFLALYQHDIPSTVGPVRSLRPYFVDWVMGFDAPIAHVGGSAQALQMVDRRGAKDLDQFAHGGPYYRSGDRVAPHNMYVRMQELRRLQRDLGYERSQIKDFEWKDSSPHSQPNATDITLNYSSQQYQARFRYQADNNRYVRHLAGSPHIDANTNEPITVRNLVVIKMPTGQDGRYATMETIGNGNALVFNNGTVTEATWRQESYNDRLEIRNENGQQVPLVRGDCWFSIMPADRPVNY